MKALEPRVQSDPNVGKNNIDAYASATSVSPGETISFHVRTNNSVDFTVSIYRAPDTDTVLHQSGLQSAQDRDMPANAYEDGCGWPPGYTFKVPEDWSSGVYRAHLSTKSLAGSTDVIFVVKPITPGKTSKILLELSFTTYQAYNTAGGGAFYADTNIPVVDKVSFDRPYDDKTSGHFEKWTLPFIQWLENQHITVEYCAGIDLDAEGLDFLKNYQLLLSVGHDEYWSSKMRDNVEAFIASGGNVAFFSGNVGYWRIQFGDKNRSITCHKDNNADLWKTLGRPENLMTGVNYENGAGWWLNDNVRVVGYTVKLSQHWIFNNTKPNNERLNNGDQFGGENSSSRIVGYEAEAALFTEKNGIPVVTGEDRTPLNFQVLAVADLAGWLEWGHSGPKDEQGNDKDQGKATLGIYRNNGFVFTAATIDWARGLTGGWNAVQQITHNVITRLSLPSALFPNIINSGFEKWSAAAGGTFKPDNWLIEGDGGESGEGIETRVIREDHLVINGSYSLKIDATSDRTWVSQGNFDCDERNNYRVACWVKADKQGAIICLQSKSSWQDFAVAAHSGSGDWEYLSAVGTLNDGEKFPARVKLQVAKGVTAFFDNVTVDVQ
jgi:hypothetical protein